jgi:hypothetical protein
LFKLLLLVAMAVAATVLPAASASGFAWTHEKNVLEEPMPIEFTGTVGIDIGFATYECETHVLGVLDVGSTGFIESIEPTTGKCTGGGVLAGCKLENDSAEERPYEMHATKTKIDVTNVILTFTFDKKCFLPTKLTVTFPSVTIDPENTEEIETAFFHAKDGKFHVFMFEGEEAEAYGTLTASQPKTFGLE